MDRDPEIQSMLKKTLIELPPGPVATEDYNKAIHYIVRGVLYAKKSKRKNSI